MNPTMIQCHRALRALVPVAGFAALALACSQQPAGPDLASGGLEPAKGKPVQCDAGTEVLLFLRDDPGDALTSDGGGAYAAHTAGNGNLMLWTDGTGRNVNVTTTAFSGTTTDRIYTNTHDNPGGTDACGLDGMANGSTGSAHFVVELGDGNDIIHYGQACDGADDPGSRVTTTRSADGTTWTITGTSGVQCRTSGRGMKAVTEETGTAGGFSMTLVGQ